VGAGPVGQGLAIELGMRGIQCLLIEKNERAGHAPRAKTTNVRTREHFRRWGIAQDLRRASPFGVDYPSNVVFTTRLAGYQLAKLENAMYCAPGKNPLYSEHAQWIPQYTVEEVMREHVKTLAPVTMMFNRELVGLDQTGSSVVATIKDPDGGTLHEVEASFVVGCDGARSFVRSHIGARMEGAYGLSRNYNIVFRAPGLAQAHRHGPAIMYWQVNHDVPSLVGPMDTGDRWFFMPTQIAPDLKLGTDDSAALIRKATGFDRDYEILSADEWTASRLLATSYRDRRIFLAGDAAHLHPPYGGFGMNMGIGDAVDIGWKMAAVLQGWGGATLLDSYESERRPVHVHVMNEAVANHTRLGGSLWEHGIEDPTHAGEHVRARIGQRIRSTKLQEFYTLGTILGDRYAQSPVVVHEDGPDEPRDFLNYVPSSRPGCRAPHAWLHDDSSLFDHFGKGFTLLAGSRASQDCIGSALKAAERLGIPLALIRPDCPALGQLYPYALTLIRPDQHVAWRGDHWPADGEAVFHTVSGRAPGG
jgi:2-polyprenyl-6-methoxyphenol hydroxylase-like FAD-dependent oxidoreductase